VVCGRYFRILPFAKWMLLSRDCFAHQHQKLLGGDIKVNMIFKWFRELQRCGQTKENVKQCYENGKRSGGESRILFSIAYRRVLAFFENFLKAGPWSRANEEFSSKLEEIMRWYKDILYAKRHLDGKNKDVRLIIVLISYIALSLSGCDSTIPGWSASANSSEAAKSSIAGQDRNLNGIRDDIDVLISRSSSLDRVIDARTTYAKVLQKVADFDFENPREISLLKSEYTKSLACAMLFDDGFVENLSKETFNTPSRINQQHIFEKSLSGQFFDFGALAKLC